MISCATYLLIITLGFSTSWAALFSSQFNDNDQQFASHQNQLFSNNPFTNQLFQSEQNSFSNSLKCTQKVVKAEDLLKVIAEFIEDIPDICIKRVKVCGGCPQTHCNCPHPVFQHPPQHFPFHQNQEFIPPHLRSLFDDIELDNSDNSTQTNSTDSKARKRRSADDESDDKETDSKYDHNSYGSNHHGPNQYGYQQNYGPNQYGYQQNYGPNHYGYQQNYGPNPYNHQYGYHQNSYGSYGIYGPYEYQHQYDQPHSVQYVYNSGVKSYPHVVHLNSPYDSNVENYKEYLRYKWNDPTSNGNLYKHYNSL